MNVKQTMEDVILKPHAQTLLEALLVLVKLGTLEMVLLVMVSLLFFNIFLFFLFLENLRYFFFLS